jgi:hypothetical protein
MRANRKTTRQSISRYTCSIEIARVNTTTHADKNAASWIGMVVSNGVNISIRSATIEKKEYLDNFGACRCSESRRTSGSFARSGILFRGPWMRSASPYDKGKADERDRSGLPSRHSAST